jgi:hypothetical protein
LPEKIKTIFSARKFHGSFGGLPGESESRGGTFCKFLRSAAFARSNKLTHVINAHIQLALKHTMPHFSSQPDEFCGIVSPSCA